MYKISCTYRKFLMFPAWADLALRVDAIQNVINYQVDPQVFRGGVATAVPQQLFDGKGPL